MILTMASGYSVRGVGLWYPRLPSGWSCGPFQKLDVSKNLAISAHF
jgi:hypothetical protein